MLLISQLFKNASLGVILLAIKTANVFGTSDFQVAFD